MFFLVYLSTLFFKIDIIITSNIYKKANTLKERKWKKKKIKENKKLRRLRTASNFLFFSIFYYFLKLFLYIYDDNCNSLYINTRINKRIIKNKLEMAFFSVFFIIFIYFLFIFLYKLRDNTSYVNLYQKTRCFLTIFTRF
jgi:hypothetical protein